MKLIFCVINITFLQIEILHIAFHESGQTCSKYPLFLQYIKKKLMQLLLGSTVIQSI